MVGEEPQSNERNFEEILSRLEEVVGQLEGGELTLEQSLVIFEEGIRLSRMGKNRLDQAERRVEELLGGADPASTQNLPARPALNDLPEDRDS